MGGESIEPEGRRFSLMAESLADLSWDSVVYALKAWEHADDSLLPLERRATIRVGSRFPQVGELRLLAYGHTPQPTEAREQWLWLVDVLRKHGAKLQSWIGPMRYTYPFSDRPDVRVPDGCDITPAPPLPREIDCALERLGEGRRSVGIEYVMQHPAFTGWVGEKFGETPARAGERIEAKWRQAYQAAVQEARG